MDSVEPTSAGMPMTADEAKDQAKGFIAGLFDFSFTTFITIKFIKLLYLLVLLFIAIAWLIGVIAGFTAGFFAGIGGIIVVTLVAFLYVIFARMWLELVVVLFRIGENTSIMAKKA